jgi:hypothetical protein
MIKIIESGSVNADLAIEGLARLMDARDFGREKDAILEQVPGCSLKLVSIVASPSGKPVRACCTIPASMIRGVTMVVWRCHYSLACSFC